MKDGDHLIWSDYHLDYDDWKDDLEDEFPDMTEDERMQMMYERNNSYLDDERCNLNIQMAMPIIIIGDLGLWNGRRTGYKDVPSGNIRDCLYSDTDYTTWYVDRLGDLRCDAVHHDGTNHYLYRAFKPGISEAQMDRLKEKIYDGSVTRADITRVTMRLGDEIGKVYGWNFPQKPKTQDRAR